MLILLIIIERVVPVFPITRINVRRVTSLVLADNVGRFHILLTACTLIGRTDEIYDIVFHCKAGAARFTGRGNRTDVESSAA